ncbi:MAG: iron-sulfur cluster assembly scaffold protein [Candidatus Pacebacteria bacterium]|jgi:nitrogen fixation NifU-like protein|nr:iron-sulfur cluster assembly scaffold protein [Candidatus Paceibacterota bacterium]MDD5722089.1 iron-sulfur cluster assembly scaffold protein [Candidatus Paceibacterota bacterium]
MYNKKVLQHFKSPHNFGKIQNADGQGQVGNVVCGDVMNLYLKIGKNKKGEEIIEDVKFETYGCVAAIATSSIITDLAKGKTIKQAIGLNKDSIIDTLEELPAIKIHCSVLAIDALNEAIYNYLHKNKRDIPKELQKRHQRIEKEKQIIEKKYADWINSSKD